MWKRPGRKKHPRKKVKLKRIRRGNESPSSQMKSINCGVGLGTEAGASIPSRLSRIGMGCDIDWIEGQSTCKARTKARWVTGMGWALERRL
jgi:hypothetical protein